MKQYRKLNFDLIKNTVAYMIDNYDKSSVMEEKVIFVWQKEINEIKCLYLILVL